MKAPMTYSRSLIEDLRDIDVEGPVRTQVDKLQTILLHAIQELERHELFLAALRKSDAE
jgi:hypothetical protein